jgi:hypothetical protein
MSAPLLRCAPDAVLMTLSYLDFYDVVSFGSTHSTTAKLARRLERGSFTTFHQLSRRVVRYAPTDRVVWFLQNLATKTPQQKAAIDAMASDGIFTRFAATRASRDIVHAIHRKLKGLGGDAFVSEFAETLITKSLKYGSDPPFLQFIIQLYPWAVRGVHLLLGLRLGFASVCQQLIAARTKCNRSLETATRLSQATVFSVYGRCDPSLLIYFLTYFRPENPTDYCNDVHAMAFLFRGRCDRVDAMLAVMRQQGKMQFRQDRSQKRLVNETYTNSDLRRMIGIDNICRSLVVFFKTIQPLHEDTARMLVGNRGNFTVLNEALVDVELLHEPMTAVQRCAQHGEFMKFSDIDD